MNILINSCCEVDQEHEGGAVSISSGLGNAKRVTDGWFVQYVGTASGITAKRVATTDFPGFPYATEVTVGTGAGSVANTDILQIFQFVEWADVMALQFGTANALDTSAGFWITSTISGTFGFALNNSAGSRNRTTPITLTANTPQFISLTSIAGDTAGTWGPDGNGVGMYFQICMASGSTYLTATIDTWQNGDFVMESGTTTSAFLTTSGAKFRVSGLCYNAGTSLAEIRNTTIGAIDECQRRYRKSYDPGVTPGTTGVDSFVTHIPYGTTIVFPIRFEQPMCKVPTAKYYSPGTGTLNKIYDFSTSSDINVTGEVGLGTKGTNPYATATSGHGYRLHYVMDTGL